MIIKKYEKLINALPLILFTFLFAVSIFWFSDLTDAQFLYIHDQSPFLAREDALVTMNAWSRDWLGSDGGMNPISSLRALRFIFFENLGFSLKQAEQVYFTLIFVTPAITMYLFLANVFRSFKKRKESDNAAIISATIGSFLYSFNLYLIILWHAGHYTSVGFLYALFPLVLLQLWKVQFQDENPLVAGIKAGLLFLLMGSATPPNLIALVGSSFLIFLVVSFFVSEARKTTLNVLLTIVIIALMAVLLNLWWMLPYFNTMLFGSKGFINAGDSGIDYVSLIAEPSGIVRRLKLFMKWTMDGAWHGRYFHSFYPFYNTDILQLVWFSLITFSFTGFLHVKALKDKRLKFAATFAAILFVVSVIFAKGIKEPFSAFFIFLFKYVPLFNMFRSPGNKFGSGLVFALAILLAVSVYLFIKKKSRPVYQKLLVLIVVPVIIVVYGQPLLTGVALKEVTSGRMPSNVTSIPYDYEKVVALVNGDSDDFRVLNVPGKVYGGYKPNDDLESGYEGPDMLEKLLNKPSIHRPAHTRTARDSAEVIWEILDNKNYELLPFLNVKYILQRCDVINSEFSFHCEDEISEKYGKYLAEYKTLKVFEVSADYYGERFSVAKNVKQVEKLGDFFNEVSALNNDSSAYFVETQNQAKVLDPEVLSRDSAIPSIKTKKISNSRYVLDVSGAEEPFLLVFSEGFHKDWKLHIYPESPDSDSIGVNTLDATVIDESAHYKINGYANAWSLDTDKICASVSCAENEAGTYNFSIVLDFTPNRLLFIGLHISVITLLCVVGMLVVSIYMRRNNLADK